MLETRNQIIIRAVKEVVYELATDIEEWPRILSHYRAVHFLDPAGSNQRRVFMAARHFGIPVSWTSLQTLDSAAGRIRYLHIGGVTRGMEVDWMLRHVGEGIEVVIVHRLPCPAGLLRFPPARYIVGRFFVRGIADRTLHGIKARAESAVRTT